MNEKNELQKREAVEGVRKRARNDKKGKGAGAERGHRWLLLVVDVVLLAAIVAAVILIAVALNPTTDTVGEVTEVRTVIYQIELVNVDADLFQVSGGDTVIDAESGNVIGVVEYHDGGRVSADYDSDYATEEGGKYFATKIEHPEGRKTYVVTIRVSADYEAGAGYTVGNCRLAVGRTYRLRFGQYVGSGECILLQKITN
ncbi:MAG: DUF4330 family protein [Clostridia bacterium]|nr:DUF4330 family protein [Clostridia bacterium]